MKNVLYCIVNHLNLKPSVSMRLFDAFVGSILNYSCEVNGFGKKQKCRESSFNPFPHNDTF